MGRKGKVSDKEKIASIHAYLNQELSLLQIARRYSINVSSVKRWLIRYKTFGEEGLRSSSKNTSYCSSLKEMAVKAYLSGEGSLDQICIKYKIHSNQQLYSWILKYNSHEKLKTSGTGGNKIMTKGRKTTYEERIQIVKYCIEHENNYAETAEKYQVSYQQVYTWLKKYEEKGVEGLLDRRGRTKPENKMSELEKLRAENRLLKAQNKRQEMEAAFLKKLDEIERRRF